MSVSLVKTTPELIRAEGIVKQAQAVCTNATNEASVALMRLAGTEGSEDDIQAIEFWMGSVSRWTAHIVDSLADAKVYFTEGWSDLYEPSVKGVETYAADLAKSVENLQWHARNANYADPTA